MTVLGVSFLKEGIADFKGVMMAFMGIFYAGMGAGQAWHLWGPRDFM